MRTESRRWLWVVVAGFLLSPSPSSPPSSCLLLSRLRAGLSAAWRVARSARPPACLSVWSASLAPSLRLSPSPCLPASLRLRRRRRCLCELALPSPLTIRNPRGERARGTPGLVVLEPAARRAERAGPLPLLRRRGREPAGTLRQGLSGRGTFSFTKGFWFSPRIGNFSHVPCPLRGALARTEVPGGSEGAGSENGMRLE